MHVSAVFPLGLYCPLGHRHSLFFSETSDPRAQSNPLRKLPFIVLLDRSLWYILASQLKDILGGFPERHTPGVVLKGLPPFMLA